MLAGADDGVFLATVDLAALRAHRAAPFGRALLDAAAQPRPALCAFPRASDFRGVGALGRMSVPL